MGRKTSLRDVSLETQGNGVGAALWSSQAPALPAPCSWTRLGGGYRQLTQLFCSWMETPLFLFPRKDNRTGMAPCSACWGHPAQGKDMHTHMQTYPEFRALWPILPQILLPVLWTGQGMNTRTFRAGTALWIQGDDAPLCSAPWMGHLLLRERGMSPRYVKAHGEGCRDVPEDA